MWLARLLLGCTQESGSGCTKFEAPVPHPGRGVKWTFAGLRPSEGEVWAAGANPRVTGMRMVFISYRDGKIPEHRGRENGGPRLGVCNADISTPCGVFFRVVIV